VGCAAGRFLDLMNGWECYGSEIVPAYVEIARKRHGNRIFAGAFEEYPVRDGFFDAITLQDVFDHMREPVAALGQCRAMLKPGGLLVIKVHNISCLYAKIAGSHFYALVPPSHLFYYNKRTLKLALENNGFRMLDAKFIAHLLKLQTVFLRLSRNDKHSAAYKTYHSLAGSWLGNLKVRKNLHDVITVVATRD
jgi:SAM-dependent methyltransferase